ncbi:Bug family tripartite tricarboxylate transporter substrate binding protein [Cupriavidus consociatus]|uniref:Bug family tripartite tricarboxylate transporter substrate binding protein n=1 Tax=Cupriavidus consociatus TaxID=2821357 RepID=UPI001AE38CA9|nr:MULTISPECIES: tripartite tricarboxylate transporter substrate binding protein [unclassified Cupriavidus]MBP0624845.1 tripartite tricarboxylate transporter substrate binding protein [Cupriavidus sp. LEh25]MDK2661572.1 tripartite tricarboxylate transporter substrate binding protein [Cupriavidus sp. LEh21]
MKRRACLGLLLLAGLTGAAHGASYPDRIVRIVVPSIAGSAPDIIARQVAERLTATWKQQVIVENKPGGNGIVAMSALRQSAPDGYTLGLFHAAAAVVTPMLYKEAKFDIQRDTEVAATLAYTPMMFVTDPKSGYRSLADVLKAGKAHPDDIAIGSPTRGSVPHLTAEMMGQLQKAKFRQISFSGTTQAIQAVVKGDVPIYVDGIAPLVPLVKSGRLKALAVTSDTELPGLDGIPLAKDVAPGLVAKGWFAVFAPKGTPGAVLDEVNAAVGRTLAQSVFVDRLKDLGTYPMAQSRAESARFVQAEKVRWEKVIQDAGVKAE